MGVDQRVGILGGTFDPIHFGHLAAAQEVAWTLNLERILFIPTHQQPLKQSESSSGPEHRLAMVRLATASNPLFDVNTVELDRGGVSYTVDTLRALRQADASTAYWLILGTDALLDLGRWHRPEEILGMAEIAAVHRAGWERATLDAMYAEVPSARGRVQHIPIPGLDISATDLRGRLQDGRPIRYLVPDAVEAYIREQGLYRR